MAVDIVWGIYWVLAWFFFVIVALQNIEEFSFADIFYSIGGSLLATAITFGIGSQILSHFIS